MYKFFADFAAGLATPEKKNHAAAMMQGRPLADQGSMFAQYNLGLLPTHGEEVSKDYKEAANGRLLAAEQGNVCAQTILGPIQACE